jgi:5'-phosphate synthase pdxT subunit
VKIGLLALQGAVSEHKIAMRELGVEVIDVRETTDLNNLDGLIMPGGESTTLRKLLKNANMWNAIKKSNLPIMGTCAGAILLGKCDDETFGKMNVEIDRNYYGRQKDSFQSKITVKDDKEFNGIFIRAPAITSIGENVVSIAQDGENIVGCTESKYMALTFHPELTNDFRFHKLWLEGLK